MSRMAGSSMCTEPPGLPSAFEAAAAPLTVTVVLSGEFDVTNQVSLSARLARIRESGPRQLIFEMAQVGFMDCASARLITDTGAWLPAGVKPVIRHASPVVRRLLEVSGLGKLCDWEPGDRQDA